MDTSRYLSMCLCDFRLQLLSLPALPLSGSVVLLFRRLRLPLLALLLLPLTAKSFSTCTRLADAVIICAFCAFVRLSFGFGFGFGFDFGFGFASLRFALCARVIM